MPDWEQLYQEQDTGWDRGEISPALHTFINKGALDDVKSVLIPGCGRGYEVVELAKRGFDVTALDLAPSAIAHLNQMLQEAGVAANTVCTDIFEYHAPKSFDAIYEQTCLCAIEPSERKKYAAQVYIWLKPQGKLLLNMMQTGDAGGPPFHCDLMDMKALFPSDTWVWQEEPPFMTHRNRKSPRFELGYILTKLEKET
ncbi:MAG: methyltransferase domain-containing protein [Ghiorsea sp.]|nr:methyltransferase domain-containing protein [Ghiorsea sp.]MDQ7057167.1 methyltransferase domain-containing protein [Ghiorsea sp.]